MPSCAQFQKLTDEFEDKVLKTALGSPEEMPTLVDKYSSSVKALFESPSPSL
jgi:hypothetical protein